MGVEKVSETSGRNGFTWEEVDGAFVQFVALKLPAEYSENEKIEFLQKLHSEDVFTDTFITKGIRKESDILIFHMHKDIEVLARRTREIISTSIMKKGEVAHIFTGIIRKSKYGSRVTPDEFAIIGNTKGKFLVVYPFVKTVDWYLIEFKKRAETMAEHVKVGRKYGNIKQLLAYSFGVDDQEFIVAYETDNLVEFQDLVMELRETEARRYTMRDTPIITAIRGNINEII